MTRYLSRLGGAPNIHQFLKVINAPHDWEVNAVNMGEMIDPMLLELTKVGEKDPDYVLLVDSLCLKDTLGNLPTPYPLCQYIMVMAE